MGVASRISINTLCLSAAHLAEQAEAVVRLGISAISPVISQVIDFGVDQSSRLFRDSGLRVAAVTHLAFGYATAEEAAKERERLLATISIAERIGAETVIMTTGGRGGLAWSDAAARFAAEVAPCAERAQKAEIKLMIEPTSHLYADVSIVHRLSDAVRLARDADIHVAIDLFACWADSDIEAAITAAVPIAGLVQVGDYVYGDRSLPCRAVPGDGAVPLDRLIALIEGSGFRGTYDIEVIGPRLAMEGHQAGLRRTTTYVAACLAHQEKAE